MLENASDIFLVRRNEIILHKTWKNRVLHSFRPAPLTIISRTVVGIRERQCTENCKGNFFIMFMEYFPAQRCKKIAWRLHYTESVYEASATPSGRNLVLRYKLILTQRSHKEDYSRILLIIIFEYHSRQSEAVPVYCASSELRLYSEYISCNLNMFQCTRGSNRVRCEDLTVAGCCWHNWICWQYDPDTSDYRHCLLLT